MHCIDDLGEVVEKRFDMPGGGWVQFRTVPPAIFRAIQKQTVKKKVDFKKVDGIPGRFPFEEVDEDLRNELFWDAAIASWNEFSFKHPETKALILCTPETCTKENKALLINNSKEFVSFATDSLKILSEDDAKVAEQAAKN